MSEHTEHTERSEHTDPLGSPRAQPSRTGSERFYVRFASLGDAATSGTSDADDEGAPRAWAAILAEAIAGSHDVSFCNLAAPGATARDVWETQLPEALRHRADLASLIVGLHDTMRSSWDVVALRTALLMSAAALTSRGAILMTVRFHDHARVMRLPRPLARLMSSRLEELNEILDEVHDRYGGIRLDLSELPGVYEPRFWTGDRLRPSELGHRAIAAHFAALLHDRGLTFRAPTTECTRPVDDTRGVLGQLVPRLARRAGDLGPALALAMARGIRLGLRPGGAA
ncbi:lysophospholipase L1-like esterase [Marmoricola sp. URHA0025 HA25]